MSTTELRRRPRRLLPRNTRRRLAGEQLNLLWAVYVADRGNLRLRNRLVEHYLPSVRRLAGAIARECASATRRTPWARP